MKAIAIVLCGVFLFSNVQAESFYYHRDGKTYLKKDGKFYVKKDGKFYRLKKKRKVASKDGDVDLESIEKSHMTQSQSSILAPAIDRSKNFQVSLGINTGKLENDDGEETESSLGLEAGIGYRFYLSERFSIMPGINLRVVDRTDEVTGTDNEGVRDAKVISRDIGASVKIGADFSLAKDSIIRPFIFGSYSKGELDLEAIVDDIDMDVTAAYDRIGYGLGLEFETEMGLVPYVKFEQSQYEFGEMEFSATDTNTGVKSSGTTELSDDEDKENTLSLGVGYFF